MKKLLLFCLTSLLALTASAMPARPGTFTVQQSDGTVLTLRMVGDEHFHYFLDINSGRRMQRAENGDYTVIPEQDFVWMQAAAKQRLSLANALRMERMEKFQRAAGISMNPADVSVSGPRKTVGNFNNNLNGQKKGLVILVNFADLDHSIENPQKEWEAAFNEEGYSKNGHVGSVHDYFYDQSYGKFDLEFDVVGPVTVSKTMSYYGKNNSYGSDSHAAEMVAEACKLVDSAVDYKDYDWDGDGEVDQVYVIYAGYGESSGASEDTIWPHEYWLQYGYGQKLTLDGVTVDTYACSCELRGSGRNGTPIMNGIGTACHEFSHCIGYPDFYDVDYTGCFGMDDWDVLGSGGYNGPSFACEVPVGFTAYERWMAGWLEPIELTEGCYVENMPNLLDEPVAYMIANKNKGTKSKPVNEYFLLENRQNEKWFSYPKDSHGMLVLHVDYNKDAWAMNTVNNSSSHPRMIIVPAGKTFGTYNAQYKSWYATNEEYRSMLFPGSRDVTELTDESHYSCGGKLYNRNTNGTYLLGMPLTEIAESADKGTISFTVKGGVDFGYRWNVTFNAGSGTTTMESWTQKENNETIVLPEAKSEFEYWRFMGWTTSEVKETSERPADLYPAGTVYKPTDDVTLYAVYGIASTGPLLDEYKLTDDLVNGQRYLLLSKKAVSEAGVIGVDPTKLVLGTATKTVEGTPVDVDFTASVPLAVAPESQLVWKASYVGELLSLVSSDGKYLSITNNGLTLSDSPVYLGWDSNYGLYATSSSMNRYFIHLSSGKFSVSATKQANSRVYLYELSDFSDKNITYTSHPHYLDGVQQLPFDGAADAPVYDLQGRALQRMATKDDVKKAINGIYIQGGRKVLR